MTSDQAGRVGISAGINAPSSRSRSQSPPPAPPILPPLPVPAGVAAAALKDTGVSDQLLPPPPPAKPPPPPNPSKWLADAGTEFESMCSVSMENRFRFSPFFTDLRIDMLRDSKTQLEIANVLPKQRYHKEGATIIHELLEKGSISSDRYFDLIGREVGNMLLETNVFAQHFSLETITFQSTLIAQACKQNLASWKE